MLVLAKFEPFCGFCATRRWWFWQKWPLQFSLQVKVTAALLWQFN